MVFFSVVPSIDIFEWVISFIEHSGFVATCLLGFVLIMNPKYRFHFFVSLPLLVAIAIGGVISASWTEAARKGYDMTLPSLRQALESYIVTGEGDMMHILESDIYPPVFGMIELKYLLNDLLSHTFVHSNAHNMLNVPVTYNKGNDFYAASLGDPMVFTSGIYKNGNESLWDAQMYKLDYAADALQLKKGDNVLDIGCGWGRLVQRFTDVHGANVTGITLSEEQRQFGLKLNGNNGATLLLQDAMQLKDRNDLPVGGFDKITSLEMAEHVGILRYQEFLRIVHSILKDDGVLYFQVAGFRRHFLWDDLVWGMFLGEHIFPGADASCTIGWVTAQLERAGFEVQRVSF